jgi:hypothetical protein
MLVSTWALFSIVSGDLGVFSSHKLTHVNLAYTPRDQKASFQAQMAGDVKTCVLISFNRAERCLPNKGGISGKLP